MFNSAKHQKGNTLCSSEKFWYTTILNPYASEITDDNFQYFDFFTPMKRKQVFITVNQLKMKTVKREIFLDRDKEYNY